MKTIGPISIKLRHFSIKTDLKKPHRKFHVHDLNIDKDMAVEKIKVKKIMLN